MRAETTVRERMVVFWARQADTMREYGEARLLAMCARNLAYWTARATTLDAEEQTP